MQVFSSFDEVTLRHAKTSKIIQDVFEKTCICKIFLIQRKKVVYIALAFHKTTTYSTVFIQNYLHFCQYTRALRNIQVKSFNN